MKKFTVNNITGLQPAPLLKISSFTNLSSVFPKFIVEHIIVE